MNHALSMGSHLLVCSALAISQVAWAGDLDLTDAEKEAVKNEQQVAKFHEVQGKVWPEALIYKYIKATPEEAAAVFFAYEEHPKFIPDCQKVISKKLETAKHEVNYTVSLPFPINSENYTVINQLKTYDQGLIAFKQGLVSEDKGKSYEISWVLKEETSNTQTSVGEIRFEPMGQGTLMTYHNFIVPKSSLAGWFVKQAKEKVQAIAKSVAERVVQQRESEPTELDKKVDYLKEALGEN
jgi:hypothetical protein